MGAAPLLKRAPHRFPRRAWRLAANPTHTHTATERARGIAHRAAAGAPGPRTGCVDGGRADGGGRGAAGRRAAAGGGARATVGGGVVTVALVATPTPVFHVALTRKDPTVPCSLDTYMSDSTTTVPCVVTVARSDPGTMNDAACARRRPVSGAGTGAHVAESDERAESGGVNGTGTPATGDDVGRHQGRLAFDRKQHWPTRPVLGPTVTFDEHSAGRPELQARHQARGFIHVASDRVRVQALGPTAPAPGRKRDTRPNRCQLKRQCRPA